MKFIYLFFLNSNVISNNFHFTATIDKSQHQNDASDWSNEYRALFILLNTSSSQWIVLEYV